MTPIPRPVVHVTPPPVIPVRPQLLVALARPLGALGLKAARRRRAVGDGENRAKFGGATTGGP
jgi:hypothetical protein